LSLYDLYSLFVPNWFMETVQLLLTASCLSLPSIHCEVGIAQHLAFLIQTMLELRSRLQDGFVPETLTDLKASALHPHELLQNNLRVFP